MVQLLFIKKDFFDLYSINVTTVQDNRVQALHLVDKSTQEITLTVLNCYLQSGTGNLIKTRKRVESLKKIYNFLEKNKSQYITVAGDFNFITNKIDSSRWIFKDLQEKELWVKIQSNFKLNDNFRRENPHKRIYTKISTLGSRRIDRIYTSELNAKCCHIPVAFSDHKLSPGVTFSCNPCGHEKWGAGVWKLNAVLLQDEESNKQFAGLYNCYRELKSHFTNVTEWWDWVKERIKHFYLIKGKLKSKQNKDDIVLKELEIQRMIEHLPDDQLQHCEQYKTLKKEIIDYENTKIQKHKLHLKIESIAQEMETPSKEFFEDEYKKKRKSQITVLKDGEKLQTNKSDIIQTIHNFYTDLWQKPDNIHEFTQDSYLDQIEYPDINNSEYCSPLMSMEDVETAFKDQYKLGSSPGGDGLTYEFYKTHWEVLKKDLHEVFINSYINNELPPSMYEATVKLTPKRNDLADLQNWRPISLLNIDYKILARVIYNKINTFLNSRASKEQKGIFIERSLFEVHYNTHSVINLSKEFHNTNIGIMKVDLHKAFDHVNHKFLFKCLKKMKLSKWLIKWIKMMYKHPTSRILANGP